MKIGIFTDLRFTALSTPTGVTKHIVQMVEGLYKQPGFELVVLAAKDQLNDQNVILANNVLSYLNVRTLPHSWHYIYWQSLLLNKFSYDEYTADLDWVYCPKNDYLPLDKTRYAVTFHGAHELDPDYPNPKGLLPQLMKWRSKLSYQRIVRQASLILTVSEFLKQKTIEWFNVDHSRIVVVGNGVEEEFFKIGASAEYLPNSYYLSVGGLNYLDGGDRIVEIAAMLKATSDNREIWVAGNQNEPNLVQQAKSLGNIKLLGYLKKDNLAEIMSNASALLFLTRYETFGIAAAEAMASGLPVITVNSTAVPEIVGDAGFYITQNIFNPSDFLADSDRVFQIISIGKRRAENFHWLNCVEKLISILKSTP